MRPYDIKLHGLSDAERVEALRDFIDQLCAPDDDDKRLYGLSEKQAQIFAVLKNNGGRIATRDALTDVVYPYGPPESEHAITHHIKNMRPKIKAGGYTITAHYSVGYSMQRKERLT